MANDPEIAASQLRFEFVAMLFALAVAELAIQAGTLALQGKVALGQGYWPSISHLFLSAFVIATSWIGWSTSKTGMRPTSSSIFSWAFVLLFLDVVLVVFYFILVKGVDFAIPRREGDVVAASAMNETFWVLAIFVVYLLWDIITKFVCVDDPGSLLERLLERRRWRRPLVTVSCVVLATLSYSLVRYATDVWTVLLVDFSLLSIVLLFRAWKEYETASQPGGNERARAKAGRLCIALFAVYASTLFGARWMYNG